MKSKKMSIRISEGDLDIPETIGEDTVWIDGVDRAVRRDSLGSFLLLETNSAVTLTVYTQNASRTEDVHTGYPMGMQVWLLSFEKGGYKAEYVPEFENLLQYCGVSIRVTGKKGIRMITAIDKDRRTALTEGTLAEPGYLQPRNGSL